MRYCNLGIILVSYIWLVSLIHWYCWRFSYAYSYATYVQQKKTKPTPFLSSLLDNFSQNLSQTFKNSHWRQIWTALIVCIQFHQKSLSINDVINNKNSCSNFLCQSHSHKLCLSTHKKAGYQYFQFFDYLC